MESSCPSNVQDHVARGTFVRKRLAVLARAVSTWPTLRVQFRDSGFSQSRRSAARVKTRDYIHDWSGSAARRLMNLGVQPVQRCKTLRSAVASAVARVTRSARVIGSRSAVKSVGAVVVVGVRMVVASVLRERCGGAADGDVSVWDTTLLSTNDRRRARRREAQRVSLLEDARTLQRSVARIRAQWYT